MRIEICIGTTCHLLGGSYLEEVVKKYKDNKKLEFKYTTCFEVCNGKIPAPVVRIEGKYYGNMNINDLEDIIKKYLKENKSGDK